MEAEIPGTPAMAISRPSARPLSTPAPRLPEPALAWRVQGEWIIGQTAGGNPTHESWVMNDQFQLLPSADGETEFKVLLRQELECARARGGRRGVAPPAASLRFSRTLPPQPAPLDPP